MNKRIIILSDGPVPTPEHTKVEGGGLRCWGLASGLRDSSSEKLEITVAYNDDYKSKNGKFTKEHEGIEVRTWQLDSIQDLIAGYDTVLVSYCMGELSVRVARYIRPDQQLVLDCYVPIYIEVSARDSANKEQEYYAFNTDVERWSFVLKRGDLFLCASEPQKKYYEGVLSAVGRINPLTYGDDNILIVPYGIYRDEPSPKSTPISDMIGKDAKSYKRILWFGGIYPWFDLRDLVDAVREINEKTPVKLMIVGAKNPFNNHPDFVSRYEQLMAHIAKRDDDVVYVQGWVDFNTRADWYLDSDLVVVINKLGPENNLAWRTRLVDFVWADLPIATNGGDPLGEMLLSKNAAVRLDASNTASLVEGITSSLIDTKAINTMKKNIKSVRSELLWSEVTKKLSENLIATKRSKDFTTLGINDFVVGQQAYGNNRLTRLVRKARKVPAYAKKHGYRTTARILKDKVRSKLPASGSHDSDKPEMVFISHQLDMSGAPFILMDMAEEYSGSNDSMPTKFITYLPVHNDNIKTLNASGIKPVVIAEKSQLPRIAKGSTVVLNTVAHSEALKDDLFTKAENGYIRKLVWYVHEDEPELLFRTDERTRVHKLLETGRLEFFIAAERTKSHYEKFFNLKKGFNKVIYRHKVDKKYHNIYKPEAFSKKISFSLPGTVGDGRKGQLPVFYAFNEFYNHHYKSNPSAYRDFELVYVGVIDDFLSRQLIHHEKSLDGRFVHHGRLTHDECMKVVSKANFTVCYSMRECLPLFVYEGMIAGHPILRNDSSGLEEQLDAGKNGYLLESSDYRQLVSTIEEVLNKKKTTDAMLAQMSQRSYDIAVACEGNSYLPALSGTLKD